MLHNLPYFTVSQIKVYDKQTDLSRKAGYDVEQRNYTMDVVLKREYNHGYIANAEIGGGTKDRYTAQTFHLGYGDISRLSVYGDMNNPNQNPRPGNQGDWTPQSMADGENTSKKAGLDYQTKGREGNWNENFTSEVSWLKKDRHTDSYSQQYADPLDIFSNGIDSRLTRDFNWNANNKLESGDFTWSVGSSYQEKRVNELAADSTHNLEERINLSRRNVWNRYRQFNLSSSVNYLRKLPWGDLLILNASGSYGSQRNKDNNTTNLSYFQLGTDDRQVLTGNNPSHNYQFEGSASYQIRLANSLTFSPTLTYKQSYQHTQFEYLTNDTVDRSSYTSGLLTRNGIASANLIYVKYGNGGNTTIFTNALEIERKQEHYNVLSAFGRQTPHKNYWLPYFHSNYAFQSMTNTLMLHYTLSATTPQMSLMYGPNNAIDPLVTIWRNSSLKKTVTNHFDVLYTHYFPWRNSYLGTQAYWNAWHGRIGYQKSMDATTGHYDFRPGNVNGNWNGNVNLYGAIDLDSAGHLNLSAASDFLYTHDVDFDITDGGLANTLSKVNNSSFSQTMKLTYKNNNFQAGLNGSFGATHASSKRSGFENFTYYNFNYGVNLQAPLFWKLNFVTDFTIYSRRGYAVESMNENDVVWNASLSRSFLKNKLIVSLEAYDILHQLSKNSVTINSQARREIHVNTIPNYLMFRLQYHFNILPKR